ncbi:MAG TPA: molybdopterin-dependent oxidoreductase [Acidimicrobiia bacterium]
MGRRTNLALALLLSLAVVSGLASQAIGVDWALDLTVVHGVIALAIVGLAPWKTRIVRRGLGRRRQGRVLSLTLLALVLVTLLSGLAHSHGVLQTIGPLTVMQVHVGAGVSALGLVVDHYRRHPVKPRLVDLDRRVFLRGATLTAAASFLWLGWEGALQAVTAPGKDRRFSGAHARASHDPSGLPTTSWLNDTIPRIEPGAWSLDVAGRSLTLGDLENMPQDTLSAVLDCTGGWFSEQEWTGVRLDRLLEAAGWRSFVVWSETGYSRRFPVRDLSSTWLVTKVGGEPLSAGHGFPARIVAPARRGFWWVKWVSRLELSSVPWWVQPPFPLT